MNYLLKFGGGTGAMFGVFTGPMADLAAPTIGARIGAGAELRLTLTLATGFEIAADEFTNRLT